MPASMVLGGVLVVGSGGSQGQAGPARTSQEDARLTSPVSIDAPDNAARHGGARQYNIAGEIILSGDWAWPRING